MSNDMAKRSVAYGALSLVIPLLGLVSFALGLSAFRRAKPDAWPPIGGKGMAITGMALSALSMAIWSVALFRLLRS
jgi:hypothetical protein